MICYNVLTCLHPTIISSLIYFMVWGGYTILLIGDWHEFEIGDWPWKMMVIGDPDPSGDCCLKPGSDWLKDL